MNILPINNCESINTASRRTGKQQFRVAAVSRPVMLGVGFLLHVSPAHSDSQKEVEAVEASQWRQVSPQ